MQRVCALHSRVAGLVCCTEEIAGAAAITKRDRGDERGGWLLVAVSMARASLCKAGCWQHRRCRHGQMCHSVDVIDQHREQSPSLLVLAWSSTNGYIDSTLVTVTVHMHPLSLLLLPFTPL
ncbi:hypothetical protein GQ54DRAFT_48558 [Martensiomyces pterosporus]|nr:hypothetical protein GQ54DRAFT_48558 [Martensiomyces pterosporus]